MARKAEAGVIVGVAAAGAVVRVLQTRLGYEQAVARRGDGRSWVWLLTFAGLPVVAFIGAIAAPRRVRSVVVAALAANVAVYLIFKPIVMIRLGNVGLQILVSQLALVALTAVAAHAGSHRVSQA